MVLERFPLRLHEKNRASEMGNQNLHACTDQKIESTPTAVGTLAYFFYVVEIKTDPRELERNTISYFIYFIFCQFCEFGNGFIIHSFIFHLLGNINFFIFSCYC